jgi:hypothetical protein
MSQEAYTEFQDLESLCEVTSEWITLGEIDKWSYIWNLSEFSTQKAYKALIGYQQCPPHFTWIWSTSCQAKHKFFFWLLLHDRLNTRNLLGGKTSSLHVMTVPLHNADKKKPLFIYFGPVLLLRNAGALKEQKISQFWNLYPIWKIYWSFHLACIL